VTAQITGEATGTQQASFSRTTQQPDVRTALMQIAKALETLAQSMPAETRPSAAGLNRLGFQPLAPPSERKLEVKRRKEIKLD